MLFNRNNKNVVLTAKFFGFLIALFTCALANADELKLGLAIGKGTYSSIVRTNEATDFYVLPRWSYYNKRFYVENLDLGYNVVDVNNISVDLTTKQSFDALLFQQGSLKNSFLLGLTAELPISLPWIGEPEDFFFPDKRRLSYLAGMSAFVRFNQWQLAQEVHYDISNVHNGFEISNEARYVNNLAFLNLKPLSVAFTGRTRWLSDDYANYYYGVSHSETTNTFEFLPGASLITSLKFEMSYALNEQWRFISSFRREWFPSEFTQALHIGKTQQDLMFTGMMYSW